MLSHSEVIGQGLKCVNVGKGTTGQDQLDVAISYV